MLLAAINIYWLIKQELSQVFSVFHFSFFILVITQTRVQLGSLVLFLSLILVSLYMFGIKGTGMQDSKAQVNPGISLHVWY